MNFKIIHDSGAYLKSNKTFLIHEKVKIRINITFTHGYMHLITNVNKIHLHTRTAVNCILFLT